MTDSNVYVLEVRDGVILYLNAQTRARDGWHWGSDDQFVSGPFASYELAMEVSKARRPLPVRDVPRSIRAMPFSERTASQRRHGSERAHDRSFAPVGS